MSKTIIIKYNLFIYFFQIDQYNLIDLQINYRNLHSSLNNYLKLKEKTLFQIKIPTLEYFIQNYSN